MNNVRSMSRAFTPCFLGEVSDDHQELIPILEAEPNAARCFADGAEMMQHLPHADVNHPVSARIQEHEDRRAIGPTHLESAQGLKSRSFASRRKRRLVADRIADALLA